MQGELGKKSELQMGFEPTTLRDPLSYWRLYGEYKRLRITGNVVKEDDFYIFYKIIFNHFFGWSLEF